MTQSNHLNKQKLHTLKNQKTTGESSNTVEQSKPAEPIEPTETIEPVETHKPTHTHIYSEATCTKAASCTCGEIASPAIGHKWINATCINPKTCEQCGITDGTQLEHSYEKFVCKNCGNTDQQGIAKSINPKLSFKPKTYYTNHYVSEDCIRSEQIDFEKENQIGYGINYCVPFESLSYPPDNIESIPQDIDNPKGGLGYYTIYNGKKYYDDCGSGCLAEGVYYKLTDTEIIVFSSEQELLKFKMNLDGTLTVTYSTWLLGTGHKPYFNVGDICW